MNIIKLKTEEELSKAACDLMIERLTRIENPVIGLATGSTPEGMYKCLIDCYKRGIVDFSNVTSFNLDEYVGLDESHPCSYGYYMKENLFEHVNIGEDHAFVPSGTETNLEEHCKNYESIIGSVGKIDIQILGIGINGHIGFNEPGTSFASRTHVVELNESTREVNSRFFDSIDEVPTMAVTMGIETIMEANEIVLLITGKNKAETVKQLIESDITEDFPASALKNHPNFTLIVDEAAYSLV